MRTLFAAFAAVAVTVAVSACTLYFEGSSSNNNVLPDASSGEPDAETIPPEDAGGPIKDAGEPGTDGGCCGQPPDADPGCGNPDGGSFPDAGEVPPPDAAY